MQVGDQVQLSKHGRSVFRWAAQGLCKTGKVVALRPGYVCVRRNDTAQGMKAACNMAYEVDLWYPAEPAYWEAVQ